MAGPEIDEDRDKSVRAELPGLRADDRPHGFMEGAGRMTEVRRSLAAYLVATLVTVVALIYSLQLWRADLRIPFSYDGDSLCAQLWTKGVLENGWYLTNPSLGAPFRMEMHDFPLADGLHFVALKALAWAAGDYALAFNAYYLATYVLAAVAAVFALRRLGVALGPAVACAVLYAFLPYHFIRGEHHLFLSGYYLVPLALLVCVRLYRDGELLFREREGGRARLELRGRRAIGALGLAALLGCGGVYYAAFACYLLLVAGACAAWSRGRAHPLGSALILVGVIALGVAAGAAPRWSYAQKHGANPESVRRGTAEVESWGLRVAQMVLPVAGHRIAPLARLRAAYDADQTTPSLESGPAALGAVGAVGFLGLLAALALRRPGASKVVDGLAALNIAAFVLATTGGLGAIFGHLVSPWLRAYNRMSVVIAFLALAAVGLVLTRAARAATPGWPSLAARLGVGAVLVVGLLDQTTPGFVPDYDGVRAAFEADADFVARVEAALPPRSMVFQLPQVDFPEGTHPPGIWSYDLSRPYLHSRAVRWSFGAMKGRPADAWQKAALDRPLPEMARTLALVGFDGIALDRDGFADRGAALGEALVRLTAAPPIVGRDGKMAFYDLRPFAAALRRDLGPERWDAERAIAARPVTPEWGRGFSFRESGPDGKTWRWSSGEGEVRLTNPTDRPRRVTLSMALGLASPGRGTVRLEGPGGATEHAAAWGAAGVPCSLPVVVPPGGATLRFACDAPAIRPAGGRRSLVFRVDGLCVEEHADGPPAAARGEAGAVRR